MQREELSLRRAAVCNKCKVDPNVVRIKHNIELYWLILSVISWGPIWSLRTNQFEDQLLRWFILIARKSEGVWYFQMNYCIYCRNCCDEIIHHIEHTYFVTPSEILSKILMLPLSRSFPTAPGPSSWNLCWKSASFCPNFSMSCWVICVNFLFVGTSLKKWKWVLKNDCRSKTW